MDHISRDYDAVSTDLKRRCSTLFDELKNISAHYTSFSKNTCSKTTELEHKNSVS